MKALTMLWTDVRILVVDTGKLWWRLLPQLLGLYLLGWLGFQLALKLALHNRGCSWGLKPPVSSSDLAM